MGIGKRLKEVRESKKLTQSQLAKLLNITPSSIANYENGISSPKEEILLKIFDALEVEPNYLFQDSYTKTDFDCTLDEQAHLKKFRQLDSYGKKTVQLVLNSEFERVQEQSMIEEEQERRTEYAQDIMIHALPLKPYVGNYGGAGLGVYLGENDNFSPQLIKVPEGMNCIDFVIGVNGDSMEPLYYNEDRVGIKKDALVKEGDIGLFILNGDCFIKEFGGDKLISLNKKYEDIMLYEDDTMKCVGKVLGKV